VSIASREVVSSRPPRARPLGPRERSTDALLPRAAARLLAFTALAAFGAVHWGRMTGPAGEGPVLVVLAAALPGALALLAARHLSRPAARAGAVALVTLALVVVALLAVGIPARLLEPRAWEELAGGLLRGAGDMPSARIPYRGLDEWTRAVLLLGGGLLVALGAVLAFAPRAGPGLGRPAGAAIALGVLYGTPAVQLESGRPWITGALFALLLAAFLFLERVRHDGARLAAAGLATVLLVALVVAPRIDRERPLLDAEELAQGISQSSTSRFDWSHRYGPLDWPRDGGEVLRVRADRPAYWKAATLSRFDGLRWTRGGAPAVGVLDEHPAPLEPEWTQRIRVVVRGMVSSDFVTAGYVLRGPEGTQGEPVASGPDTFRTLRRPLRRGSSYTAVVHVPTPSERELDAAVAAYPAFGGHYLSLELPTRATAATVGAPVDGPFAPRGVSFAPWGHEGEPRALGDGPVDGLALLEASPYRRAYALARRLRRRADTPQAFAREVEDHLAGDAFAYSETPRPARVPLDGFLFGDRRGYCQQFSGAMALLLRMGGVPARVVAGFSPGTRDDRRGEFVVRDTDAHSWVEAWFPRVGWVTYDPTPGDAPAAAQTADAARDDDARESGGPAPASERALGLPGLGGFGGDDGVEEGAPTALWLGLGLGLGGLALALALLWRRRLLALAEPGAAVAELERALSRTGRAARASTTLSEVAARFGGTGAEPYLRALLAERYGYADRRATAEERAALRRELAAGLGLGGRVRAWWALPPGVPGGHTGRGSLLGRRRDGGYAARRRERSR
jgi:transglutaminase-like putative cysteine protease